MPLLILYETDYGTFPSSGSGVLEGYWKGLYRHQEVFGGGKACRGPCITPASAVDLVFIPADWLVYGGTSKIWMERRHLNMGFVSGTKN